MMSRGQCPRGGGACECLHPPPSGNAVSAPVICVNKILGNQPLCHPLTKAFPYAYDYMGQAKTPVQASPSLSNGRPFMS